MHCTIVFVYRAVMIALDGYTGDSSEAAHIDSRQQWHPRPGRRGEGSGSSSRSINDECSVQVQKASAKRARTRGSESRREGGAQDELELIDEAMTVLVVLELGVKESRDSMDGTALCDGGETRPCVRPGQHTQTGTSGMNE